MSEEKVPHKTTIETIRNVFSGIGEKITKFQGKNPEGTKGLDSPDRPQKNITNPPEIKKKEKTFFVETSAVNAKIIELESNFNTVFTNYLKNESDIFNIIKDCGNLFTFIQTLRDFDNINDKEEKNQLVKEAYDLLVYVYEDIRLLAPNIRYEYLNGSDRFPTKSLVASKYMSTLIELIKDANKQVDLRISLNTNKQGFKPEWTLILSLLKKEYINENKEQKDSINAATTGAYAMLWTLYKSEPNSGGWLSKLRSDWEDIYSNLYKILNLPPYAEFVEKHGFIVTDVLDSDRNPEWDKELYKNSLRFNREIKKVTL